MHQQTKRCSTAIFALLLAHRVDPGLQNGPNVMLNGARLVFQEKSAKLFNADGTQISGFPKEFAAGVDASGGWTLIRDGKTSNQRYVVVYKDRRVFVIDLKTALVSYYRAE